MISENTSDQLAYLASRPAFEALVARALLLIIERLATMDANIERVRAVAASLEAAAPDWIAKIGELVVKANTAPVVGLTDEEKAVLAQAADILEQKIAQVNASFPVA